MGIGTRARRQSSTAPRHGEVQAQEDAGEEAAVAAQRQADAAEERTLLAEQNASIAEQRQAHAEERTADLFKKHERLAREVSPLQAAAEALREYAEGSRKPNKKDVPALAAELAKTKTELQYSTKDQHGLFQELQQAEKKTRNCNEAPTFCGRSGGTRPKNSMRRLRRSMNEKPQNALRPSNRRTINGANEKQQEERISDNE